MTATFIDKNGNNINVGDYIALQDNHDTTYRSILKITSLNERYKSIAYEETHVNIAGVLASPEEVSKGKRRRSSFRSFLKMDKVSVDIMYDNETLEPVAYADVNYYTPTTHLTKTGGVIPVYYLRLSKPLTLHQLDRITEMSGFKKVDSYQKNGAYVVPTYAEGVLDFLSDFEPFPFVKTTNVKLSNHNDAKVKKVGKFIDSQVLVYNQHNAADNRIYFKVNRILHQRDYNRLLALFRDGNYELLDWHLVGGVNGGDRTIHNTSYEIPDYGWITFTKYQAKWKSQSDFYEVRFVPFEQNEHIFEQIKENNENQMTANKKEHGYYLLSRPKSIGTEPLEGFLRHEPTEENRFGKVIYDRKLTLKEIKNYSLGIVADEKDFVGKGWTESFGGEVYEGKVTGISKTGVSFSISDAIPDGNESWSRFYETLIENEATDITIPVLVYDEYLEANVADEGVVTDNAWLSEAFLGASTVYSDKRVIDKENDDYLSIALVGEDGSFSQRIQPTDKKWKPEYAQVIEKAKADAERTKKAIAERFAEEQKYNKGKWRSESFPIIISDERPTVDDIKIGDLVLVESKYGGIFIDGRKFFMDKVIGMEEQNDAVIPKSDFRKAKKNKQKLYNWRDEIDVVEKQGKLLRPIYALPFVEMMHEETSNVYVEEKGISVTPQSRTSNLEFWYIPYTHGIYRRKMKAGGYKLDEKIFYPLDVSKIKDEQGDKLKVSFYLERFNGTYSLDKIHLFEYDKPADDSIKETNHSNNSPMTDLKVVTDNAVHQNIIDNGRKIVNDFELDGVSVNVYLMNDSLLLSGNNGVRISNRLMTVESYEDELKKIPALKKEIKKGIRKASSPYKDFANEAIEFSAKYFGFFMEESQETRFDDFVKNIVKKDGYETFGFIWMDRAKTHLLVACDCFDGKLYEKFKIDRELLEANGFDFFKDKKSRLNDSPVTKAAEKDLEEVEKPTTDELFKSDSYHADNVKGFIHLNKKDLTENQEDVIVEVGRTYKNTQLKGTISDEAILSAIDFLVKFDYVERSNDKFRILPLHIEGGTSLIDKVYEKYLDLQGRYDMFDLFSKEIDGRLYKVKYNPQGTVIVTFDNYTVKTNAKDYNQTDLSHLLRLELEKYLTPKFGKPDKVYSDLFVSPIWKYPLEFVQDTIDGECLKGNLKGKSRIKYLTDDVFEYRFLGFLIYKYHIKFTNTAWHVNAINWGNETSEGDNWAFTPEQEIQNKNNPTGVGVSGIGDTKNEAIENALKRICQHDQRTAVEMVHKSAVTSAMARKDDVPNEVLADYPKLRDYYFEKALNLDESNPNAKFIKTLHDHFANGKKLNATDLKRIGKENGFEDVSYIYEQAELAWTIWYKKMALSYKHNPKAGFDAFVDFYKNVQPTYSATSSLKIMAQQYSTAAPISYALAHFTDAWSAKSIFEPSAGNGLLVSNAPYDKTIVNEFDKGRLENLKTQPFKEILNLDASDENAFEEFKGKMDVLLMNPPFRSFEHEVKYFKGQQIGRLDDLMVRIGLETIHNDGRAGIVIGGGKLDNAPLFDEYGKMTKLHGKLWSWLFRHYHVTDIIKISGSKLYRKQGTSFNVILILINGRKSIPFGYAPVLSDKNRHFEDFVTTHEELWDRVETARKNAYRNQEDLGRLLDKEIRKLKMEDDFLRNDVSEIKGDLNGSFDLYLGGKPQFSILNSASVSSEVKRQEKLKSQPEKAVKVTSLSEAKEVYLTFLSEYNLNSLNFTPKMGEIHQNNEKIAILQQDGKIRDTKGKLIIFD